MQPTPLLNRRKEDRPESESDRLARRLLQILMMLAVSLISTLVSMYFSLADPTFFLGLATILLFIWLVITAMDLDTALRTESDDNDDGNPPLAPA